MAATATLGVIAGFYLGCSLAIPLAEIHLKSYLQRVATHDDASVKEASDLLGILQHSSKPPCSDAELSYFRQLIFQSENLKDAGRIQGGRVECSATGGRQLQPIERFQAGHVGPEVAASYGNLVPIRDLQMKRTGLEEGGVFVVFGSGLPALENSLPVHLAVDPAAEIPAGPSGQASSGDSVDGASQEVEREGDMLVAKRCSPLMSSCVTASLSAGEAQRGELAAVAVTSVLSGIAAAFLTITLLVLRRRSVALHRQLKRAVAENKLHLAYQPIVNLPDGKVVGAEALARWTTKDGTQVEPEVFIKVAEEHGFVGSITSFVLRRALHEFREVFQKIPDFRLNINVAAADLVDPRFVPMLDEVVAQASIRPGNLVLEVTERSTASREDAMDSIRELRHKGYGIYIDDFGTGYSNLSYLLYLSVDTIKIDKAFVRAIGTESVTTAILPQIINMARSMNLGVVVEGIESEGQAHYFSTDNVKIYGQGFLFGRPIPACEFMQLVGLAAQQPAIAGSPEAAAIPAWARLGSSVQTAIAP